MRSVVISDVHVPSEVDMGTYMFILNVIESLKPDRVEILGDYGDLMGLSRFAKAPTEVGVLQDDLDAIYDALLQLRVRAPDAHIKFINGNHDDRVRRYLQEQAPGLFGINALTTQSLYRLDELEIEYGEGQYRVGKLWMLHGHEIKVNGGTNPARSAMLKINDSAIFGHVHKFSVSHKQSFTGKNFFVYSNACIADLNPSYLTMPDWVQGFSVIDFSESGLFQVQQVQVWKEDDGTRLCFVDGKPYKETPVEKPKAKRGRPKKKVV